MIEREEPHRIPAMSTDEEASTWIAEHLPAVRLSRWSRRSCRWIRSLVVSAERDTRTLGGSAPRVGWIPRDRRRPGALRPGDT
jgi:hypothetical protein